MPLPGPAMRRVRPGGTFLLIGPGTGLGVSALITAGDRFVPVQSEAAHMTFAASTPEETRVVAHLARQARRTSNETLLSGPGLVTASAALGRTATPAPQAITRNAARAPTPQPPPPPLIVTPASPAAH